MSVRLTAAEAKRLLDSSQKATKPKRGRKAIPQKDCAPNRCCTCGYTTKGETDEARHNKETGHARFESMFKVTR